MPRTTVLVLMLALVSGTANGQATKPAGRVKQAAGKLLDTTVTNLASGAADALLGSKGKSLQGLLGTGDLAGVSCQPGTTPMRVGTVPAGVGQPVAFTPTAGQLLVAAAKKRLIGKRLDPAATQAAVGAQLVCVTPQQAALGMQATPGVPVGAGAEYQAAMAQAAAAQAAMAQGAMVSGAVSPGQGAMPNVGKMLIGASPAGAMIAAAPLVGKGVKALFGKGQTKEAMIKDLAHGKLILKGVKFIAGSDALEAGFEDDIAALAEALQAIEGKYVLNIPAEVDGKSPPDTVIARRRIVKLWAHLLVAGIQEPRLQALGIYPPELDPKKKWPKLGDSKVEIIRLPADFKP